MAIYTEPNERIIAFRIDDGPWCFDERVLKLWTVAGPVVEVTGHRNGKPPSHPGTGRIGRLFRLLLTLGA